MKYNNYSLTWYGDMVSISGPAQYARAILEILIKGGAKIRLEPMNSGAPMADLDSFWQEQLPKLTRTPPGFVKINHCKPHEATGNPSGGPNILLTHWDTLDIPRQWIDPMRRNHTAVWSPCRYSNDKSSLGNSITTIPMPLYKDPGGTVSDIIGIDKDTMVFGTTALWDQRSNLADLVIAFTAEFSASDKVALVIKTNTKNPLSGEERQIVLNLTRDLKNQINKENKPPVVVIQDIFTQNAMDAIIRRFDAYISLERGSSTNITLGKCLAMGKPCVVTMQGVAMDYINTYGKYDKMILPVSVAKDPVYAYPGGNPIDRWTKPDVAMAIDQMRIAYMNHVTGGHLKQKEAIIQAVQEGPFSLDRVTSKLEEAIGQFVPKSVVQFT
jgi:hypothetical protein